MAYDEDLAKRIRGVFQAAEADGTLGEGFTERRMFGGLGFLVGGHLAVTASGQGGLMVRAGGEAADDLVNTTPAEVVVMKGRAMTGWVRVPDQAITDEPDLRRWVHVGLSFVETLAPKS